MRASRLCGVVNGEKERVESRRGALRQARSVQLWRGDEVGEGRVPVQVGFQRDAAFQAIGNMGVLPPNAMSMPRYAT